MNKQGPKGISWTDYTWNPIVGCLGPGGTEQYPKRCSYCYAFKLSKRRLHKHTNFVAGRAQADTFMPHFHSDRLSQPSTVKKPSKIFVCSMGDLFGDWVPWEWIAEVMGVVKHCPQHVFQFLTKNPKRSAAEFLNPWPKNCWVGATVTNQEDADERLPELLKADAAVRFVSVEPMLEAINLQYPPGIWPDGPIYCCDGNECACQGAPVDPPLVYGISWLIIGAQTGPGAVKPDPAWVQGLIDQCWAAGVPCFVKDSLYKDFPVREWPA